jgi:hypothetical protein
VGFSNENYELLLTYLTNFFGCLFNTMSYDSNLMNYENIDKSETVYQNDTILSDLLKAKMSGCDFWMF